MRTVTTVREMQQIADEIRSHGKRIAIVPTMGYLHEGHLSLVRIARQRADLVVTTIFVNPTQFGPLEDFERYPRDLDRDARLAQAVGTDILFTPTMEEMYPEQYLSFVAVEKITSALEGASRPGHFRGVATIVAKLFNVVKPHLAVFGQKDAQQTIVIQQMIRDLNFDVGLVVAPIIREPDGLAMSSRNIYLSVEERKESVVLSRSLKLAEDLIQGDEKDRSKIVDEMTRLISAQPSARIDYISIADPSNLEEITTLQSGSSVLISLAVRIGVTRLIDNSVITVP